MAATTDLQLDASVEDQGVLDFLEKLHDGGKSFFHSMQEGEKALKHFGITTREDVAKSLIALDKIMKDDEHTFEMQQQAIKKTIAQVKSAGIAYDDWTDSLKAMHTGLESEQEKLQKQQEAIGDSIVAYDKMRRSAEDLNKAHDSKEIVENMKVWEERKRILQSSQEETARGIELERKYTMAMEKMHVEALKLNQAFDVRLQKEWLKAMDDNTRATRRNEEALGDEIVVLNKMHAEAERMNKAFDNKVIEKAERDWKDFLNQIRAVEEGVGELILAERKHERQMVENINAANKMNQAFDEQRVKAERAAQEGLGDQISRHIRLGKEMDKVHLDALKMNRTFDAQRVAAKRAAQEGLGDQIVQQMKLSRQMEKMHKEGLRMNDTFDKQAKASRFLSRQFQTLAVVANRVFYAFIAYKILSTVENAFRRLAQITWEFSKSAEAAEAKIYGLTRSLGFTAKIMAEVMLAARSIPKEFDEISDAASLMVARGLEPTERNLRTLLATSIAIDKPLEGLIDTFARVTISAGTNVRGLKNLGVGFQEFGQELNVAKDRTVALMNILERRNMPVLKKVGETVEGLTTRFVNLLGEVTREEIKPFWEQWKSGLSAINRDLVNVLKHRDELMKADPSIRKGLMADLERAEQEFAELSDRKLALRAQIDNTSVMFATSMTEQAKRDFVEVSRELMEVGKQMRQLDRIIEKRRASGRPLDGPPPEFAEATRIQQAANAIDEQKTAVEKMLALELARGDEQKNEAVRIQQKVAAHRVVVAQMDELLAINKEVVKDDEKEIAILTRKHESLAAIRRLLEPKGGSGGKTEEEKIFDLNQKRLLQDAKGRGIMHEHIAQLSIIQLAMDKQDATTEKLIAKGALESEILESQVEAKRISLLLDQKKVEINTEWQRRRKQIVDDADRKAREVESIEEAIMERKAQSLQLLARGEENQFDVRRKQLSNFANEQIREIGHIQEALKKASEATDDPDIIMHMLGLSGKADEVVEQFRNALDAANKELDRKQLFARIKLFFEADFSNARNETDVVIVGLGSLANSLSMLSDNLGVVINRVTSFSESVSQGYAAGGPFGAAVAAVTNVVGQLAIWRKKNEEEVKRLTEAYSRQVETIDNLIDKKRIMEGNVTELQAIESKMMGIRASLTFQFGAVFDDIIDDFLGNQHEWLRRAAEGDKLAQHLFDVVPEYLQLIIDLNNTLITEIKKLIDIRQNIPRDFAASFFDLPDQAVLDIFNAQLKDFVALISELPEDLQQRELQDRALQMAGLMRSLEQEVLDAQIEDIEKSSELRIEAIEEASRLEQEIIQSSISATSLIAAQALRLKFQSEFGAARGNVGLTSDVTRRFEEEAATLDLIRQQDIQKEIAELVAKQQQDIADEEAERDRLIQAAREASDLRLHELLTDLLTDLGIKIPEGISELIEDYLPLPLPVELVGASDEISELLGGGTLEGSPHWTKFETVLDMLLTGEFTKGWLPLVMDVNIVDSFPLIIDDRDLFDGFPTRIEVDVVGGIPAFPNLMNVNVTGGIPAFPAFPTTMNVLVTGGIPAFPAFPAFPEFPQKIELGADSIRYLGQISTYTNHMKTEIQALIRDGLWVKSQSSLPISINAIADNLKVVPVSIISGMMTFPDAMDVNILSLADGLINTQPIIVDLTGVTLLGDTTGGGNTGVIDIGDAGKRNFSSFQSTSPAVENLTLVISSDDNPEEIADKVLKGMNILKQKHGETFGVD